MFQQEYNDKKTGSAHPAQAAIFQEMENILQGNQTQRLISYTLQAFSNFISKLFMSIIERDMVNSAASFKAGTHFRSPGLST